MSAQVHGRIGAKSGWFSYEMGDSLTTGVAPARRTAFFLGYGAGGMLTEVGWKAFDEAIAWTVAATGATPAPSTPSASAAPAPGLLTASEPPVVAQPEVAPAIAAPAPALQQAEGLGQTGGPSVGCARDSGQGNIHVVDFENRAIGAYDVPTLKKDWATRWDFGVKEGRASIVERGSCQALRVAYPANQVGPRTNGASWTQNFDDVHDEVFLRYDVKFGDGFDFRAGGKLPGLFGGKRNTGGHKPTGNDGFSARIVWQSGGQMTTVPVPPGPSRQVWGPLLLDGYGNDRCRTTSVRTGDPFRAGAVVYDRAASDDEHAGSP